MRDDVDGGRVRAALAQVQEEVLAHGVHARVARARAACFLEALRGYEAVCAV